MSLPFESAPGMERLPGVPVENFRSASLNKDPLLYPGERPADSFVTDGETVMSLSCELQDGKLDFTVQTDGESQPLEDYLASRGAAPMEQRIPVLAFGANMNPASLKSKFTKTGRPDMQVIPTVYTQLEGSDVVWSGAPGINGNFIACLYSGPETEDSKVQVGINFLTREQLLVLHATELNYQFAEVPVEVQGEYMPVYYYEGRDTIALHEGRPVAVAGIPAENRALVERNTTEMVEEMLTHEDVLDELRDIEPTFPAEIDQAQQYIDFVRTFKSTPEKPQPKYEFKQKLIRILAEKGLTGVTDEDVDGLVSWANPSTLRTYGEWQRGRQPSEIYVLPTSEIPVGAWADPKAREKVIRGVSTHFHRHFPIDKE